MALLSPLRIFKCMVLGFILCGPLIFHLYLTPNIDFRGIELNNTQNYPNHSPNFAQEDGLNSICIYDHIYLFTPSDQVFSHQIYLKKNYIYRFQFETYTPHNPSLMLDTVLKSPSGVSYHLTNYECVVETNIEYIYFHYGAAETGWHTFSINSQTQENMNVRISINQTETVSRVFQTSDQSAPYVFNRSILDFYDIHLYTQYSKNRHYEIPMLQDHVYWFNFFRVNSLVPGDIEQTGYTNPNVSMNFILDTTQFQYWDTIPTSAYSLETNIGSFGSGTMVDEQIILRFGSHVTETAYLTINLEYGASLPVNFAFLVWAEGSPCADCDGRNSHTNTSEDDDCNDEVSDNSTMVDSLLGNNTISVIEGLYNSINSFFLEQYDIVGYIILGIIVGANIIHKYFYKDDNKKHIDEYDKNQEGREVEVCKSYSR